MVMPKGHSSVYHGMALWRCPLISVPVSASYFPSSSHIYVSSLGRRKHYGQDNANTGLAGKLLENNFGPKDWEILMSLDQD